MKAIRMLLTSSFALGASALNASAHGCGFSIGFCIPFFSFGIGFGCGGPCYPAYTAPTYAYSQPAIYSDPAPSAPVTVPQENYRWTPSTPGTGKWIPESQPYTFTPVAGPSPRKAETVSVASSPEGIKVYTITATPHP